MTPGEPSVEELVSLARAADGETARSLLTHAARGPADEVLAEAAGLVEDGREELAAVLLEELGRRQAGARRSAAALAAGALRTDLRADVLDRLLDVAAHGGAHVDAITALAGHDDAVVRGAVVRALYGVEAPRAIETLLGLSADPDAAVRSEAVFALGSQLDVDDHRVREALATALGDDDDEVRLEAAIGLGRRGDDRAVDVLVEALGGGEDRIGVLEAAARLGRPELLAPLIALGRRRSDAHPWLLAAAVLACRPGSWN